MTDVFDDDHLDDLEDEFDVDVEVPELLSVDVKVLREGGSATVRMSWWHAVSDELLEQAIRDMAPAAVQASRLLNP